MAETIEEWYRLVIDCLPVGVLFIDREGRVRVLNRLLSGLTGRREEDILGRLFREFLDCRRPERNKLLQTLAYGKEFRDLKPEDVFPIAASNEYVASTYIIRDESGSEKGAMAVFMPAGRRQELENAVIKAEKLAILGQLVAGLVHEIRNPVTAVRGFLQLLQKQLRGNPKESYIPVMLAELERVNRLITEFLQLTRPGYPKRAECSINKIVREVAMLLESEASIRNLSVILKTEEDIPPVRADAEQLKQVFVNIIKNAFDALNDGGEVYIKTSWDRHEGFVRVAFKDTGAGMDEHTVNNMFTPFFTTKEDGTGLGMFISKRIIDNHGGSIEIRSKPGEGTTVTVLLPAV